MDAVNLQPLPALTTKTRTHARPIDRTDRQKHRKQPASVRWTLAVALPVILFLLYGIIFPSSVQKMATNYTGVALDFLRREAASPVAKQPAMTSEIIETKVPADMPVIISQPVTEDIPVPVPAETTSTTSADQSPVKYYIIGGCFGNKENADKFLSELIVRGYQAEQAGVTKKGHVRISYSSFSEREPALLYLQRIKEEENPAAWLLKY
jgi:cell division septation protein DedD